MKRTTKMFTTKNGVYYGEAAMIGKYNKYNTIQEETGGALPQDNDLQVVHRLHDPF